MPKQFKCLKNYYIIFQKFFIIFEKIVNTIFK